MKKKQLKNLRYISSSSSVSLLVCTYIKVTVLLSAAVVVVVAVCLGYGRTLFVVAQRRYPSNPVEHGTVTKHHHAVANSSARLIIAVIRISSSWLVTPPRTPAPLTPAPMYHTHLHVHSSRQRRTKKKITKNV